MKVLRPEKQLGLNKSVAYKTVDMFAGITKKRLYLKDGPDAQTDGNMITVPMGEPDAYQLLEHELAHVLFKSDAKAKRMFMEEYGKRVHKVAGDQGVTLHPQALETVLSFLIGVLEDHRVNSLWGILYQGSYKLLRESARRIVEANKDAAEQDLILFFLSIETGVDVPSEEFERFRPLLAESLRKVEKSSFLTTLTASKWLVTKLVDEVIRRARGEPPPPSGQPQEGDGPIILVPRPRGGKGGGGKNGSPDDEIAYSLGDGVEDGNDPESEDRDGSGKDEQDKPYEPPKVDADTKARSEALRQLLEQILPHADGRKPDEELQEPKYSSRNQDFESQHMAENALKQDVNSPDKMKEQEDKGREAMQRIVEAAKAALRNNMTRDEWLRKEAMSKVIFIDVRRRDVASLKTDEYRQIHVNRTRQEDDETVRRLRSLFYRVMGRSKMTLEDYGSEVDVQALIQRRVTGVPIPVFKHEVSGRGFRAMILVDQSSSMNGAKTYQSERAARIIRRALKFPFVKIDIWGFKSTENGQVDISRFQDGVEIFDSAKSPVQGWTPLHIATRLARRELEIGAEAKQLLVLSDGYPVYTRRDGRGYDTKFLMGLVRNEVHEARQDGINVTGVLIGHDMDKPSLQFMFGPRRHWRVMSQDRFGVDLVNLVATSFMDYLKGA